jgi:predicted nucleotidyltransferase component of viral defense system
MKDRRLSNHNLVGGTALSLYMGHRISVDLDLFTEKPFDGISLEKYLVDRYDFKGQFAIKNSLIGSINEIKVDLITHDYPLVENLLITKDGIRLYGIKDLAAMKLSAIADDGTRLKDFIDIAYLSTKLSLSDMLKAYQQKYKNSNYIRPLKGITFFEEIIHNEPIKIINEIYNWKKIEKRLQNMVERQHEIFRSPPLDRENQIEGISL